MQHWLEGYTCCSLIFEGYLSCKLLGIRESGIIGKHTQFALIMLIVQPQTKEILAHRFCGKGMRIAYQHTYIWAYSLFGISP